MTGRRLILGLLALLLVALALAGCRFLMPGSSADQGEPTRTVPQPSLFLPTKPSPTIEVPPPRD